MKRKKYEEPTMQVVKFEHQCHILAGSFEDEAVLDVEFEEETWEEDDDELTNI